MMDRRQSRPEGWSCRPQRTLQRVRHQDTKFSECSMLHTRGFWIREGDVFHPRRCWRVGGTTCIASRVWTSGRQPPAFDRFVAFLVEKAYRGVTCCNWLCRKECHIEQTDQGECTGKTYHGPERIHPL